MGHVEKCYVASLFLLAGLMIAGVVLIIVGSITGLNEAYQASSCSLCGNPRGQANSFTNNDGELSWQVTFNASIIYLGYEQWADLIYDNTTFSSERDAELFIEDTPCSTVVTCYYPVSVDTEDGFPSLRLTNPDPTGAYYQKFLGLVIAGSICAGVSLIAFIIVCCKKKK